MTIDLDAIKERCWALDDRMSKEAWTLESSGRYPGLFSVYDSHGNVVSHGVEEEQTFIAHARADVPALVAEVERLRRELHDEQVRRNEWEKMYNQAIVHPAPDALPCGHPASAARDSVTQWCSECEKGATDDH